ncbi:MAG: SWIM zinc finger family protein [Streptococcaceae bacterium]|jgi:uncharacterized Zn finger protein|nr:SWIM zinc finger family protein [Streptococcaceae bacterium]
MKRKMENEFWTLLFQPQIFKRGYAYYRENRVIAFNEQENEIQSIVDGSHPYLIKIHLKNNFPEACYCSCPYAESGKPCKHLVAVLLYWEHFAENNKIADEILSQASDNQTRFFLHKLLFNNPMLQEIFQDFLDDKLLM